MITTPNPYLQLFFDFLKRNDSAGYVYLFTYEADGHTVLQYDSDHKYLQDIEYLASLPYLRIYDQVAQQWWQLLAEQGLLQPHSCVSQAGLTQSSNDGAASGRQAELQPEAEHKLYLYLEQQLMGACPSQVKSCQQLDELHSIATTFVVALNDRIQQAVANSLFEFALSKLGNPATRQSISLLNVCAWGQETGKHVDYTFVDGVVVSNVRESHRRPFEFAGVWVELPESGKQELPVQLGFTDNRQQLMASFNVAQSQQLTTQWCLEQGYKQLVLDPKLRQVVEAYGVVDDAQPTKRWLSSGQLLTDLLRYHAEAQKYTMAQSVCKRALDDDSDWLLPRVSGVISDDHKLPF